MAGPATAADNQRGYYGGVTLFGSNATMRDSTFANMGQPETTQRTDDVAGAGLLAGYRFRDFPVRLELEGHYRFRFDNNVIDQNDPNTPRRSVYHSNIATIAVVANAFYEIRNSSSFTPFFGVSAGWARQINEASRYDVGFPGPGSNETNMRTATDRVVYGAALGVDWAFAENWAAAFTYRAISLGTTDTGTFPSGQSIENDKYLSHDLMFTLKYYFGH